ncbi:MAG: hypothetical protein QHC90_13150 [Shinella sp.]|nr:hypothetical protein [Shinella sp.]
MYEATFQPISNRADWFGTFEIVDDDTGSVIENIDGITIKIDLRKSRDCYPVLSASTENGKVTDSGNGVFEWHFTRSDMTQLCPGSYDFGLTIMRDEITIQELIGVVPIVDGVVSR